MALDMCPLCSDDEDIDVVRTLDDGRKLVGCRRCDCEWGPGEPTAALAKKRAAYSFDEMKARFPKPGGVDLEPVARAEWLKSDVLSRRSTSTSETSTRTRTTPVPKTRTELGAPTPACLTQPWIAP